MAEFDRDHRHGDCRRVGLNDGLHGGRVEARRRIAASGAAIGGRGAAGQFNPISPVAAHRRLYQSGPRAGAPSAILVRPGAGAAARDTSAGFKNPLTLGPALKFGVVFTGILFLTRAGSYFFGQIGQLITSALGGLIDTDAVLLSLAASFGENKTAAHDAVLCIILAAAANAVLKSGLAYLSRQPAFYLRLMAGFAVIVATGLVVFFVFGTRPILAF